MGITAGSRGEMPEKRPVTANIIIIIIIIINADLFAETEGFLTVI